MTDNKIITGREEILEAVKIWGGVLQHVSNTLKADREVVLEAVKKNAWVLRCASEELQNDPELKKLAQG